MRMNRVVWGAAVLAFLMGTVPVLAQQKRVSPPDVTSAVIDGSRVTVVYGRPSVKDPKSGEARKIFGTLVPYGKVWRLGANEATMLVTQQPLQFGETTVPAGAYTLFLLPEENGAKLIISKQLGQWGTQYDEKNDLARVDIKKEAIDKPVEQFTMSVEKNPSGGGMVKMSWEQTQFTAPFTVKK
jgi:hypothetical protein